MQERGSVMSLIKKIRFQGWLDILIFFRYRPGLDKFALVCVQLTKLLRKMGLFSRRTLPL